MNGRLEHELKIDQKIEKRLETAPSYMTSWYYNLKASGTTPASCEKYIDIVLKFLKNAEETDLNKISYETLQKYFIQIQKRQKPTGELVYTSDSHRLTVWYALNNFFEYMYNTKEISENYMKNIPKPKNRDLARINENRILLTKEDFKKLMNVTDIGIERHNNAMKNEKIMERYDRIYSRDKAIMILFLTTGMRKTALTEINIEDLNMQRRTISVVDKGDKLHVYNLSSQAYEIMGMWIKDRRIINPKSNALFVSEEGNRLHVNTITKCIARYSEAALGYKISPHKLRAGFCSVLYAETGDIEFVRRSVGHSNIATTQRYIVTKGDERKKASKLIESLLE